MQGENARRHDGAGFVTRFEVGSPLLRRYPVQQVGGRTILEPRVPAEDLDDFNAHIVGEIQVVHEFHRGAGPLTVCGSGRSRLHLRRAR